MVQNVFPRDILSFSSTIWTSFKTSAFEHFSFLQRSSVIELIHRDVGFFQIGLGFRLIISGRVTTKVNFQLEAYGYFHDRVRVTI